MKFAVLVIFFFILTNFSYSVADEKSKIIKVLNDTKNLQFNFEQITSKKTESGKCIIVFPNKLVCYYDNKDKKELIINNRIMAITQKRYNKSFFYPLSKTNFINILSKNELINVIQKGDILINDYINIAFINKEGSKTLIKFNKEDFHLAGWISKDQYNNEIIFKMNINSVNQYVDDKIFKLPEKN